VISFRGFETKPELLHSKSWYHIDF